MPDKEKVIKDLEFCVNGHFKVGLSLATKILALLKAQEETINDLTDITQQLNQHIKDLSEYMTPYGMVKDVKAYCELMKEHEAEWVEDKQDEHCRLIKCSNCGLTFIVGNNIPYDEWIEDKNYCRRCGARMVKPND